MIKFKLEIELGNAAMESAKDAAQALRAVADRLDSHGDESGSIRDRNGNTVGHWEVS